MANIEARWGTLRQRATDRTVEISATGAAAGVWVLVAGGIVAGLGECGAPVCGIFIGHVLQRGDEQPLLALEVEIDDPARQAGAVGDIGHRRLRIAALGQRIDCRLDQLKLPDFLRRLAAAFFGLVFPR